MNILELLGLLVVPTLPSTFGTKGCRLRALPFVRSLEFLYLGVHFDLLWGDGSQLGSRAPNSHHGL